MYRPRDQRADRPYGIHDRGRIEKDPQALAAAAGRNGPNPAMMSGANTNRLSAEESARLADVVERFEDAWQRGAQPGIDDFIPGDAPVRLPALWRLIRVDLERRLKAG